MATLLQLMINRVFMDSIERDRDAEKRRNLQGKEICGSQAIIEHLCHHPVVCQRVLSLCYFLLFGVNTL